MTPAPALPRWASACARWSASVWRLDARVDAERAALGGSDVAATAPPDLTPGSRVRIADLGVEAEVALGLPTPRGGSLPGRGSWNITSHRDRVARPVEPRTGRASGEQPGRVRRPAAARAPGDLSVPRRRPRSRSTCVASSADEAIRGRSTRASTARWWPALSGAAHHPRHRTRRAARGGRAPPARPSAGGRRSGMGEVGEGGRGVTVARLR